MIAPIEAAILVVLGERSALRYFGCYGRGSGMRHFLIITCLAALTCAAAPVQVALAQTDSPTIESGIEPLLAPDEAEPEPAKPSKPSADPQGQKEEDGQSKSQTDAEADTKPSSDRCDPACNSMSGISDPLTILRIAVAPIVLWIVKNLVSYSFQRIHMARAIYVDVEYRLLFTEQCIETGRRWVEAFDANQNQPRIPILNISREDHRLYTALQPDLRECTWGAEVAAIRLIYRSFDEIENVADRISKTYAELLAASRNLSRAPRGSRSGTNLNRYRDLIEADIARIERIFAFWLAVSLRAKKFHASNWLRRFCSFERPGDERFRWVVRSLLYGFWLWHMMCSYAPLVFLSALGGLILFGFSTPSELKAGLILFVFGSLLAELILSLWIRDLEEKRIDALVLSPFREQLEDLTVGTKKPLTYV